LDIPQASLILSPFKQNRSLKSGDGMKPLNEAGGRSCDKEKTSDFENYEKDP